MLEDVNMENIYEESSYLMMVVIGYVLIPQKMLRNVEIIQDLITTRIMLNGNVLEFDALYSMDGYVRCSNWCVVCT